jgi:hypothetical protein
MEIARSELIPFLNKEITLTATLEKFGTNKKTSLIQSFVERYY